MPSETALQRAARLLRGREPQVAAAVARQLRRTVPRYEDVERQALERSLMAVLKGLQRLVESGDERTLKRIVDDAAQLRSATGFGVDEFVMAGLCFLPVVRRFMIENDVSIEQGLLAFEAVESVALPMFGHIAMYYRDLADLTDPGKAASKWSAISFPLSIEAVEDDEDTVRTKRPGS